MPVKLNSSGGGSVTLDVPATASDSTLTLPTTGGTLAAGGPVTTSGLTMATSRLLGRTTAGTGAVEEISVGAGLTLTGGSLAASGSGGGFTSMQVFTTSGTWTKPSGINRIFIKGVGGGGAGGGVRGGVLCTGGGGGAGGYFERFLDVSAINTVSVTIGSGGTGVSADNGNAGGTTSFGIYASGNGGGGGLLENAGGGSGGTATGGNINITGQDGSIGAGQANSPGGLGGSTLLGYGGAMISEDSPGTGKIARGYGSGGSGGAGNFSSSNVAGGAGAPGVVIVLEYT